MEVNPKGTRKKFLCKSADEPKPTWKTASAINRKYLPQCEAFEEYWKTKRGETMNHRAMVVVEGGTISD